MKKKMIWIGCLLMVALMHILVLNAEDVVIIEMSQSPDGARVFFNPVGILIPPGTTVRWIQRSNYHTVTAYHPANGNRELRIPDAAKPWDSGVLKGLYPHANSYFEHTFQKKGVYDYFCEPHERAGMVGRIIVGTQKDLPVTKPLGYGAEKGRKRPPKAVAFVLPSVERILREQIVSINLDSRPEEK